MELVPMSRSFSRAKIAPLLLAQLPSQTIVRGFVSIEANVTAA
jgi:hypothetical protein